MIPISRWENDLVANSIVSTSKVSILVIVVLLKTVKQIEKIKKTFYGMEHN
jgi:hypothetical protein